MAKHILITGGAGFIGSHLADELLRQGHRVRVLDSLSAQVHGENAQRPDYLHQDVEFIQGDVRDSAAVRSSLAGVDAVFHFSAAVGVGQSMYEVERYTSVNNLGTAVLMEALIEHPVQRLLVASSMSIYGEGLCRTPRGDLLSPGERPMDQLARGLWELLDDSGCPLLPCATPENKAPQLASLYALSKYDQERMCLLLGKAYGIPAVALRFFNVFGTRQSLSNPYTGVLAIFGARYLNDRPPLVFEDGRQMRDFVPVQDVTQACLLALDSPAAPGEVFNIGSGRAHTVLEVAQTMAQILGREHLQPEITGKFRKGDIRHCFADITRAQQALGYTPQVSFEDGLLRLAEWLDGQIAHDRVSIAAAELDQRGLTVEPCPPPRQRPLEPATSPAPGVFEWFRPGEAERVEAVLADLRGLGVSRMRTVISWAHAVEDPAWYDWLLPRLAREVELLPCFTDTPPSLGVAPSRSAPPREPRAFAQFLEGLLPRLGGTFSWAELWNEPNNLNGWDRRLDPEWLTFSGMIRAAAEACHAAGKQAVLGGMCPLDEVWLDQMGRLGVLEAVDAIGIHGFPGTWENEWECWDEPVSKVREVVDRYHPGAEIWITAAGYSTWQHDEFQQLRELVRLFEAPAARCYWYAARDLYPFLPYQDVRHAHFGLQRADGTPKLSYRIWKAEGLDGLRHLSTMNGHPSHGKIVALNGFGGDGAVSSIGLRTASIVERKACTRDYVLITGGAGFIGTNLAHQILSDGESVRIFDNLSRPGVEGNLAWLREHHGSRLQIQIGDIRNLHALHEAVAGATQVFHLAGQVAVTTSLDYPLADFEINLGGTLNLLEALRLTGNPPPILFTSTNKVYGGLEDILLEEGTSRYLPIQKNLQAHGISEERPLQFHSPYGCSKGGADQYVLDYARMGDLPAVVFRMSCIYGPHQCGNEDQGWVAHFLLRALQHEPITVFGNGKQVRDILYVDDLVRAMRRAMARIGSLGGHAYNIGGGPRCSISLLELLAIIADLQGQPPRVIFDDWRSGDQRYYVSDTRAFRSLTGWRPSTQSREGISRLWHWLLQHRSGSAAPLALRTSA